MSREVEQDWVALVYIVILDQVGSAEKYASAMRNSG
jgi:hypothetical protein